MNVKERQSICDMNDEQLCRHVAEIVGPCSGAARAIKELDKKRKSGQLAWIVRRARTWLVVGEHYGRQQKFQSFPK